MSTIRLFHALPGPLQTAAASVHGWRLQQQRYGPDTETLVAAARERESWGEEDWSRWRCSALERTLGLAATAARREGRAAGEVAGTVGALASWPVLSKEELRASPAAYRVPPTERGLLVERTSGSTGTPLMVWWSRAATRQWYALVEARMRGWAGLSRHDRWAILGGRLVVPAARREPPFWVWNGGMKQLYLSSYHLGPTTVASYLEALEQRKVRSLLGYPSALASLAGLAQEAGLVGPRLEVVLTNAEPLSQLQRERISSVFGCPVRDSYGLAELVAGASECEAGRMHLWPEVGVVEILDDDGQPVAPGQVGRVVATGLVNDAMALVRYDTGDLAALDPDPEPCECGRRLPRLLSLEGRHDDVLITPDGREVGRLDPAFKAELPMREAQVVQRRVDLVVLRVVPAPGWSEQHAAQVIEALRERLGPRVQIEVELVDSLPRGPSGKVRAVLRDLAPGPRSPVPNPQSPIPGPRSPVPGTSPFISVVMPVRNEGAAIEASLGSVLAQDWPADELEVLIADGRSTDDTRDRIDRLAASHPGRSITVIDNPGQIVATGLNLAIARASGDVIVRVDGHCELAPDFVRRCVEVLDNRPRAAAVGGVLETVGEGRWGQIIATAMGSRFGVGGSAFRVGVTAPRETDTVAFPALRREAVVAAGGFDEELVRNQDDEYSYRLRRLGWTIVVDPRIQARYSSRPTLRRTFSQLFQYGYWKVRVLQKHPLQMRLRQLAPPALVAALFAGVVLCVWSPLPLVLVLGAWLAAALAATVVDSRRLPAPLALGLPLAYATLHLGYGLGVLVGLGRFLGRWGDRRGREPHSWSPGPPKARHG